jgi:phosphatidylserine/phosphatidylglycerophosphate/cardiolipin synthase-like enzyme
MSNGISAAKAYCNDEVAWIAWATDPPGIPGCLGFDVVREYLDGTGAVMDERPLATYVAFRGQSNPHWLAQNTTVWPIQRYGWRDLTLRRRRDRPELRPLGSTVRYRIRAVGDLHDGLEPVVVVPTDHIDPATHQAIHHGYEGDPRPLGYLTPPAWTNAITVTRKLPPFTSTFTNGVLSTQFLRTVLSAEPAAGALQNRLRDPKDWLRRYLSGDVVEVMREFFQQEGGRIHAALYELDDTELLALLVDNADRIDLILSDAGTRAPKKRSGDSAASESAKTQYDARNAPARKQLRALADAPGATFSLQNRMFNGTGHIGHNKFLVYVDDDGVPRSVLTGSTNWTWSGVSAQSNNCIRIDDEDVARGFLAYWTRLHADVQPEPHPPESRAKGANQGDALKRANRTSVSIPDKGGSGDIRLWFSPNMPGKAQPPAAAAANQGPTPPDLDELFGLMAGAAKAIFFLVFMPARSGLHSVVSQAVALGSERAELIVTGAVSDPQGMWGFEAASEDDDGTTVASTSPRTFRKNATSIVLATALTDRTVAGALGDFTADEILKEGQAIIHDKVVVIDPHDPVRCVVAFGSHNLGFKASYSNDENLVIVRGNQRLAQAYAVHVLDVYDHYRFRAVEAEVTAEATPGKRWDGFLDTNDRWQRKVSRTLSDYLAGSP